MSTFDKKWEKKYDEYDNEILNIWINLADRMNHNNNKNQQLLLMDEDKFPKNIIFATWYKFYEKDDNFDTGVIYFYGRKKDVLIQVECMQNFGNESPYYLKLHESFPYKTTSETIIRAIHSSIIKATVKIDKMREKCQ